jgi:predicted dehydrogenase
LDSSRTLLLQPGGRELPADGSNRRRKSYVKSAGELASSLTTKATKRSGPEPRTYGVGMLGYSFMGKAHSNAYSRMPFFFYPPPAIPRLVSICGRSERNVREAAHRFGYQKYETDWRKVVADPEVDIVDNGLPNDAHAAPCIDAAERGKSVLCEKPLGRTASESEEMLRAVTKAGVKNMVFYNYRFIPAMQLARNMVKSGAVGKVRQFRAAYLQDWITEPDFPLVWRMRRSITGSGTIGDIGSHVIDIARFLVGEIDSVSALVKTFMKERRLADQPGKTGRVDVDDAFVSIVKFRGGAIGSIEATRLAAGRKNHQRVEVEGTEGSIYFDLERQNELQYYSMLDPPGRRGFKTIIATEVTHPFGGIYWPPGHMLGWEHAMVNQVYHFFDALANDKRVEPLAATFYDGHRADQVIDAMLKSSKSSRWETVG